MTCRKCYGDICPMCGGLLGARLADGTKCGLHCVDCAEIGFCGPGGRPVTRGKGYHVLCDPDPKRLIKRCSDAVQEYEMALTKFRMADLRVASAAAKMRRFQGVLLERLART
jgi:hypothetical protein